MYVDIETLKTIEQFDPDQWTVEPTAHHYAVWRRWVVTRWDQSTLDYYLQHEWGLIGVDV